LIILNDKVENLFTINVEKRKKLSIRGILMDIDTQKSQVNKTPRNSIISRLAGVLLLKESTKHAIYNDDNNDLIFSLKNAKKEWMDANMCFEYAEAQELVDYYTYKIKACQVRYEYYLKAAKEKGIKVEVLNERINPH